MKIDPERRPTLLEMALVLCGLVTFSGLGLFFTVILPAQPELVAPGTLGRVVTHPLLWAPVLVSVLVLMSAGLATRAARASDRGLFMLALGDALAFALALAVYTVAQGGV